MAPRPLASPLLTWTVNGLLFTAVFVVFLVFEKWIEPFHRGFFCDDDSIRYPFKSNTISIGVAVAIGIIVVLPTIIGVQVSLNYRKVKICSPQVFKGCLEDVFVYAFGAFASQATCNIIKVLVGRLRPCFLAACFNNVSEVESLCSNGTERYIQDFTCIRDVREERLSFPSGHSSFIMFCMIFAALYLWIRLDRKRNRLKLLVPLLQLIYVNGAISVGLSRISDYKHHWGDVLAGGLNGLIFAILTVYSLMDRSAKPESVLPLKVNNRRQRDNGGVDDVNFDTPQPLS